MRKSKGIIKISDVTKKKPFHLYPGNHEKHVGKMTTGFYVEFEGLRTGTGHYCYDRDELLSELGWIISEFNEWHNFVVIDKRKQGVEEILKDLGVKKNKMEKNARI